LKSEGVLTVGSVPIGPYQETVYKLTSDRPVEMDTPRGRAIRQAVDLVINRSAVELSELTHEYSLSWQQTENGREMDIYIDLVDEDHLAQIKREIADFRQSQEPGD
jgi:hypothetical protein